MKYDEDIILRVGYECRLQDAEIALGKAAAAFEIRSCQFSNDLCTSEAYVESLMARDAAREPYIVLLKEAS